MALLCSVLATLLLASCAAPFGADRVTISQAYEQVEANALRGGKASAKTVAILHRYDLDRLAAHQPEEAVRQLHQKALATRERDLLFALSELSYVAANNIRRSLKPWEPRDARDYYLGSAVYAWLFLFGEAKGPPPGAFDRRFREACDFYNYSLGLALTGRKATNGVVQLQDARRRLPVGEIEFQVRAGKFPARLDEFEDILLADQYRVRGFSVRNRTGGIGTPVLCVRPLDPNLGIRLSVPATILLRAPLSLGELASGQRIFSLEVYSDFVTATVAIGGTQVPLEADLTTFRAYTLSQSKVWKLGRLQFLAPSEYIPSHLIMNQPYEPNRIPVVYVHGTFSSPTTWAEIANSLVADPVLRQRYQIWAFFYGSGNPLVYSIADLRAALTAKVRQLDPQGTNAALRQMVIIGHSQGGLVTKGTVIDTGDRLWREISPRPLEELNLSEARREEIRRLLFLKPLPFVKRVIFISTPHRGSYLANSRARRLAQKLVSLPGELFSSRTNLLGLMEGTEMGHFLRGRMPTSLDSMSPRNPALLAMAEIPVAPSVKAHSIIPVLGEGDYRQGEDGVVTYQSAHVDYVQSELIVHGKHSCQNLPATIEEVRRILYEHLEELK